MSILYKEFNINHYNINIMSRVLLLDYDGVILRNNSANKLIAHRAGLYTQKVVSIKNNYTIDSKASHDLCFNVYKGFGHTLLGINAVGIDHTEVTLRNYNNFVYSHIDYNDLTNTNNDMEDVEKVFNLCAKQDIDVYVFSNSPKRWIERTIRKQKNVAKNMKDIRDKLNVQDDDASLLKPLPKIYDMINNLFKDKEIVFVDDSACNLQYSLTKSNWVNVLYCGVNCNTNKNMHMINDLTMLKDILS